MSVGSHSGAMMAPTRRGVSWGGKRLDVNDVINTARAMGGGGEQRHEVGRGEGSG